MVDPITLTVGAGLLAAGYVGGRMSRRRTATNGSTPLDCGCGHPLALHDRSEGVCHAEVRRPHFHKNGSRNGDEWVPCACRRYTGELPVEDIIGLGLPDLKDESR